MEEYKGNSNKSKECVEEDKQITPVVKGKVTVKKETVGQKFSNVFLASTVSAVWDTLTYDVIIPAVKNLFLDMVTNGSEMLVNGRSGGRRSRSRGSERTSYSRFYRGSEERVREDDRRSNRRDRYSYSDIIFETRADAMEVHDCMLDIVRKFKMISIADFYELANAEDCERYTDRDYGWYIEDIEDATITRDRDGYKIKLPRPECIK